MNRTETKKERPINPVIKASILSKCLFWWMKDIFRIGLKRPMEQEDMYETLREHKSDGLSEKFTLLWEDELKKKNPSILRLLVRGYGVPVLGWGFIFCLSETVMRIAQPLCLGGLVSYFAPGQTQIQEQEAYWYAFGIIVSSLMPCLTFHPFILYIMQVGIKMRIGCSALIYKKTLSLSKSTTFDGLNGQVINLMSNDVGKFDIAMCFIHDLWKGPLETLLLGYFIYREVGLSAVIGVAFMLSFIPLQAWIGKKTASYRLKTAKRTDIRVKFMNEIIQGIQVIKMYTWEKSFASMVAKVRRKEMNAIRGSAYIRATLLSFFAISRFSIFLSLVSYIYFGNVITARKVFIISSFYNILNLSMVHFWPMAITTCAEAYISTKRVGEFLLKSEKKECMEYDKIIIDDKEKLRDNEKILQKLNEIKEYEFRNSKIENDEKINMKNQLYTKEVIDGLEEIDELLPKRRVENVNATQKGVILKNATAVWSLKQNNKGIMSVNLNIEQGKLCTIVGLVGSGKSTLLNVIIGELDLDDGCININGRISYAAQEPWLFEGSIKRNILFVEEYDEKRYREVVNVCALERDFELFPHGDATIVGERGVSLSGGQKARVSLARAVYKNADIYLLDDPLSAVDTHVGKHIFEKCIKKYLKDKVCVLVTHQLQYLKDVEHIVMMNQGRIEGQGTYKELNATKLEIIRSLSVEDAKNEEIKEGLPEKDRKASITENDLDDPEEEKETQKKGSVQLSVYKEYFKSVQSIAMVCFVFILFVLTQIALSGVDYYLSQWVNWEELLVANSMKNDTLTLSSIVTEQFYNTTNSSLISSIFSIDDTTTVQSIRDYYIYVYTVLMIILVYIILHRTFAFFKMCLLASINLHDKLFRGITRATMNFFNNNPSGRILNRFSKDIGAIDTILPNALIDCVSFFLEFIAIMIIVAIINYWLLIPTFFMSILFYFIRVIYINSSRSINRIESLTRSPIFSHTNATLQGLSTIRAFKAQEIVKKEFDSHLDLNTSAMYLFFTATRAFAFWLDIVCVLYISTVVLSFLVLGNSSLGGNVGLAITQVINLIGMCQWGMRQTAELENKMVSVERVVEYAELKPEPPLETSPKYRPFKGWPDNGAISFNNLSLRYSEDGEYVLKSLNFKIKPMEKIGIVGRTGAGKSSIIQALFRLAFTDGTIEIDGIDTQTLGLHDLRNKIAIIPQDPVLFSGSLRSNLDPFDQHKDDDMWNALVQVELKETVSSLAGGLDCKMSDSGSNFSMGQRQLVCLARAILKNNKILILDEATANVDPETDKLIQTTIRTKFMDCTVLTIAHRLHTVMDSDRVLVIDAGQVVEFAHPFNLIQRPGSFLRKLVDQTGNATAAMLTKLAAESYEEKGLKIPNSSSFT